MIKTVPCSFDYRKWLLQLSDLLLGIPSVHWVEVQWRKLPVCGLFWRNHWRCLQPIFTRLCLLDDGKRKYEVLIIEVMVFSILIIFHFKWHKNTFIFSILFHHYIWGYPVSTSVFMHILEVIVLWSCRKHNRWPSCIVTM